MADLNSQAKGECVVATVCTNLSSQDAPRQADNVTVNSDDFLSRLRVLKYGKKKVMQNLGNYWKGAKDNPNLLI